MQTLPLLVVTRFSAVAAAEFPPPGNNSQQSSARDGGDDQRQSWAERDEHKKDNVEGMVNEVLNLSMTDKPSEGITDQEFATSEFPDIENGPTTDVAKAEKASHKRLVLGLRNVTRQPTTKAICDWLEWMQLNKKRHADLIEPHVPHFESVSLEHAIDKYVAMRCLEIKPMRLQQALKEMVFERISAKPLTADEVKYIFDRLPTQDRAVSRAVTACYEHLEEHNDYTDDDADAIWALMQSDPAVGKKFTEIDRNRARQRKLHRAQGSRSRAEAQLRAQWDGGLAAPKRGNTVRGSKSGGSSTGGKARDEGRKEDHAEEAEVAVTETFDTEGPKRGNGNGKGTNDGQGGKKHVPGAEYA